MDSVTNQNHSQQTIYYTNGSVLGQINRTILQSVQILRPECGELHQSRPDRAGNPTLYGDIYDCNKEVDSFGLGCDNIVKKTLNGRVKGIVLELMIGMQEWKLME
mgnify:CR=1 FL=1